MDDVAEKIIAILKKNMKEPPETVSLDTKLSDLEIESLDLAVIVFDVEDVAAARSSHAKLGLKFGAIHRGPGYHFANARDPAKNLIQISSRYRTENRQC